MTTTLIKNAEIVNENRKFKANILIENELIKTIDESLSITEADVILDAEGLLLIPGMIDDQVHFRDPGLTHKGDIGTESKAALAGGITSYMEMPNTNPRCLSQDLLEDKYKIAAEKSWTNYSFYMGTANDNIEEVLKTDPKKHCGIKIFLGASTGNMLVDNPEVIEAVLKYSAETGLIVTTHCEEESVIQANLKKAVEKYGDEIPITEHPHIRNHQACYESSSKIIALAKKHHANLNVLHLTTATEMGFLQPLPLEEKFITAEVCIHHLWFTEEDYKSKGSFIKWNPAIKSKVDREALRKAVNENRIDIIATDHAPHSFEEKSNPNYLQCPAGGPLVQHALPALMELHHQDVFSLERIIEKACHNPALRYKVNKRGFIKEGYYADLTLIDLKSPWTVTKENTMYKCGWSPFEGQEFQSKIKHVFVNGNHAFNDGNFADKKTMALSFNR